MFKLSCLAKLHIALINSTQLAVQPRHVRNLPMNHVIKTFSSLIRRRRFQKQRNVQEITETRITYD